MTSVKPQTPAWLNTLGDRNPQLLRELRGRFQIRSVAVTIGIVLLIQALFALFFLLQLPADIDTTNQYCLPIQFKTPCTSTNWGRWWGDIFKTLTYLLPYVFYVPGVYALITDISQETQKGTLNFLRLSPRSSQNILLGKLLGVPILGYLSVVLFLPLHIVTAIFTGVPLAFLISFYGTLLGWGLVVFLSAMFVGFTARSLQNGIAPGPTQAIAFVLLLITVILPLINAWNGLTLWQSFKVEGVSYDYSKPLTWFYAVIDSSAFSHFFIWGNLALMGVFLWWILQRAFQNPTATLLSKLQSYGVVTYSAILLLGFMVSMPQEQHAGFHRISLFASILIYGLTIVMASLSTPRQMLLDWLLTRRNRALVARAEGASALTYRQSLRDLLLGEKSPGVTAFVINVLIALGTIAILLPTTQGDFERTVVGLLLTLALMVNYGLLIQLMLLLETPKRNVWAVGALGIVILVPSICAVLPIFNGIMGYFTPGLWLLLGNQGWGRIERFVSPVGVAMFALMIQVAIAVVQFGILRTRLRQLTRQLPETL
jgi:hypothetical protein